LNALHMATTPIAISCIDLNLMVFSYKFISYIKTSLR